MSTLNSYGQCAYCSGTAASCTCNPAPKHTPEPLVVDYIVNDKLNTITFELETQAGALVATLNKTRRNPAKCEQLSRATAERLADCYNTMQGIADPAAYRAKVDALRDAAKHLTDEVYTIDSPVMHALADRILAALVDLDGGWKS